MTRVEKFLQQLSQAIKEKGAGDIDPRRLAGISLGELLPFLERHGIEVSIEDEPEEKDPIDELFKKLDLGTDDILLVEMPTLDSKEIQEIVNMTDAQASAFVNRLRDLKDMNPIAKALLPSLMNQYQQIRNLSGGKLPPLAMMEALIRRYG